MPPHSENVLTTGIKYPKHRDSLFKTSYLWLEDKREDDGAEGLWRIHDKLYDVQEFISTHPGGQHWLRQTKGTDITEVFETHHMTSTLAEDLLPKFYVRDAKTPRNYPYTFNENGFYKTLKTNVKEALKEIPQEAISQKSKYLADMVLSLAFTLSILANYFHSYIIGVFASYFLTCTLIAAHNFLHKRDNIRMYYIGLSFLTYKEFRILHVLSHHVYTNTITDLEISLFEPLFNYLPSEKSFLIRYGTCIISPFIWPIFYHLAGLRRYLWYIFRSGFSDFGFAEIIPYTLPLAMYYIANESMFNTLWMWNFIMAVSGFHLVFVAVNAAHHHPDLFHEGDTFRPKEELDWGICQIDTTMDRYDINFSHFLVLTNFGQHALHHLFPTLDHAVLEKIWPVFRKTAKEFNIELKINSQINMIIGQYQQSVKVVPNPIAKYSTIKKLIIGQSLMRGIKRLS